ncbi:MAG: mechanosensitive ion channel family protein [Candidatus Hydrogenedentota bacterium]|nr:MAG: mechanosensitive ion channel family protein [Candidatus Hydrogenedentota bacterium]
MNWLLYGGPPWLDKMIWHNTVREYAIAFIIVLGLAAVVRLYASFLQRRLRVLAEKTKTLIDDFLLDLIDRIITPLILVGGFFLLTRILDTGGFVRVLATGLVVVAGTWYGITSVLRLIDFLAERAVAGELGKVRIDPQAVHHIRLIAKVAVWVIGLLLVLNNLGYDVTSLIAGLGIAGIAVGLAVQNILGDLFSYFCILVDKPFVIGDFIIVGDDLGVVEYIGIRSTRVRTLQGQELVISNADLTSARINNYKKMLQRRVVFTIGVTYDTPAEKLRKIPEMIREIIEGIEGIHLDRAHFSSFGDFSLNYEIVYYVHTGDYNKYMDAQQAINLGLVERFAEEGIEFAFPTQTLYVHRSPSAATN